MSLSIIDILFLVTVVLLVFNGIKNGALFSLISLLGIPIGFVVAYMFGPRFTLLLAANGIPATPLIAYLVLFFGSVLIVHILGNMIRGVVRNIPLVSQGDTLLGGVVGFIEAWLIWLLLLIVLGQFLNGIQDSLLHGQTLFNGISLNINFSQLLDWRNFYNDALSHSIFAQVNSWFVKTVPAIPQPPSLH